MLLLDSSQYFPSSPLFAEALERFEREGRLQGLFIDEGPVFGALAQSLMGRITLRVGRWPVARVRELHRRMVRDARTLMPDVVLVVKGAHVPRWCLRQIKRRTGAVLVNFATDDPFNPRVSTRAWIGALPDYDLVCTPRRANTQDLRSIGVGRVAYVPFGYKPDVHFPEEPRTAGERTRFESDVCFIGGCDEDRIAYFETLVARVPDVRLALYGGYWDRVASLCRFWRGYAVGREFRLAVNGASICVNLVRTANRDDHVMRTFEVPACGGFMLAERTEMHRTLFAEGREAVFVSTPDEMVEQVRRWLPQTASRAQMAALAHARIVGGFNRYDDRLVTILDTARASLPAGLKIGVDRNSGAGPVRRG